MDSRTHHPALLPTLPDLQNYHACFHFQKEMLRVNYCDLCAINVDIFFSHG